MRCCTNVSYGPCSSAELESITIRSPERGDAAPDARTYVSTYSSTLGTRGIGGDVEGEWRESRNIPSRWYGKSASVASAATKIEDGGWLRADPPLEASNLPIGLEAGRQRTRDREKRKVLRFPSGTPRFWPTLLANLANAVGKPFGGFPGADAGHPSYRPNFYLRHVKC